MQIDLQRFRPTENSTIGLLSIDGEFECFTLEDPIRKEKVAGDTAIPVGSYPIKLRTNGGMIKRYQVKFGETGHPGMLWLQDVPNYKWVYLHIGNAPKDTEGCILVASMYDCREMDVISASTVAYRRIYNKVLAALHDDEEVTITIS